MSAFLSNLKRRDSIEVEVAFLDYLLANNLSVCAAVPTLSGDKIVRCGSLTVCVFPFAAGEAVVYTDWKWLTERQQVVALGRWLAQLHLLSKRFAKEFSHLAARVREWTELHERLLEGAAVGTRA